MGSFRRRLLAGPAALFAACAVVGLASSASASSSSANFFAGRDGKTSFPLLNPRGIPELEPQLSDDFDVNPDYHDAEVEYFALKKRHAEEDCAGTNKDGRKMCGPLCGTWWVFPAQGSSLSTLTNLISYDA